MERLTIKEKRTSYRPDYPNRTTTDCIRKLGQLEDILEKHEISSVEELEEKIEALRLLVKNLEDSNFIKRQELDKYHKIEEELGIDLITLFEEMEKPREKYFENIYLKYKGKIWELTEQELDK